MLRLLSLLVMGLMASNVVSGAREEALDNGLREFDASEPAHRKITKDFKAYQYYGSPNLMISTDGSSHWNDHDGWGYMTKGRMTYRAGHDTECCAGNIHRMFTDFLKRAWLQKGRQITAALYAPGTVDLQLKNGAKLAIKQTTDYPFVHSIRFDFSMNQSEALEFRMRIPAWSQRYTVNLNGKEVLANVRRNILPSSSIQLQPAQGRQECLPHFRTR